MESKERIGASILSYGLVVMTITHTLAHAFEGIHLAIFSILRDEFNLSLQQLSIIAAIPLLCQSIFYIPTGLLSDRIGAKKMISVSFVIAILGALLASQTVNPLMLSIAVSLVYINTTLYHPASYSFTTKLFKKGDRPKALGLHGAGGTLGHSLGPLTVSIFIGILAFEWRHVYLIMIVPMLLGIIMVLFIKNEPVQDIYEATTAVDKKATEDRSILNYGLVMFLVFSAFLTMSTSMISTFIVLYLQDARSLSIALASLVSSGRTMTGLFAAPLGGYVASRVGEKRWLLSSLTLSFLSLAISIVFPNVIWFIVFYIASGFFTTLGMAARNSVMARLSPSRQRGLGFALFFLHASVVGIISPVLAGFIATFFGFDAIFYISLLIQIVALGVLKFYVKVD